MKLSRAVAAVVTAVSLAVLGATTGAATTATPVVTHSAKPTIVLVHGASEDGSAWNGVTARLQKAGYTVVVPAPPLRGVASDSAYVASLLKTITGPKVLVGHSYGGMIISEVAAELPDVTALVYAAALIPQPGESLQSLVSLYPGSLFGAAARTVDYAGGTDVYVDPGQFRDVFADDRSPSDAALTAAAQRPIAASATTEAATRAAPAGIPKYVLVATEDHAIPPAAERFMARRANAWTVEVRSSHDLPTSHPDAVAGVIEKAAARP